MKRVPRLLLILTLALALVLCTSCKAFDPNQKVLEYTLAAADAAELKTLDQYPNLETADLRGSTCYEAIEYYVVTHPHVKVTYDVQIGSQRYDPKTTSLDLADGSFDSQQLLENLKYLKELTSVSLTGTTLPREQLEALQAAYPTVAFTWTYRLGDMELDDTTEQLDLSHMTPEQLTEALPVLSSLPNLKEIQLMDTSGASSLEKTDVKALMDALPGVAVHYSFELFGATVTTSDERLEYIEVPIGNEGVPQIREALDIMPACTYLKMDTCGVDNEVMDQLRTDYPNILVSWRVFLPDTSVLTDDTVLRVTHQLENHNTEPLKYCTEAVYVDFGHNSKLSDISFMANMTKVECIILSGSSVKDLTPLANCNNMIWVELCFCGHLEDLSPLAGKTSIKYLNVSHTRVKDLTVPMGLNLERFNCMNAKVSTADARAFQEAHPDCLSVFKGRQPYGYGWRYNDYGYTYFEYYAHMREVFNYDAG